MDSWLWIWLAVVVVSLIAEFATMEMVSIWFVLGGLVAMILSAFHVMVEIQIAVFIAISVALLLSLRKIVLKYFSKDNVKTNFEAIIGRSFELIDPIKKNQNGSLKVNDVVWTAISEDSDAEIESGTEVVITALRGNKVIVKIREKEKEIKENKEKKK